MGGISAEVLADVSRVALPCSRAAVEAAARALRGAPALLGTRSLPGMDLERVVDAIVALASVRRVMVPTLFLLQQRGHHDPVSAVTLPGCWAARWSSRS
jgi:hypothetical protein